MCQPADFPNIIINDHGGNEISSPASLLLKNVIMFDNIKKSCNLREVCRKQVLKGYLFDAKIQFTITYGRRRSYGFKDAQPQGPAASGCRRKSACCHRSLLRILFLWRQRPVLVAKRRGLHHIQAAVARGGAVPVRRRELNSDSAGHRPSVNS